MSVKTQKALSPTKENMSPSKYSHRSDDLFSELLNLAKAAGLKVPTHLEKCNAQDQRPLLKIIPTDSAPNAQIQKLKVRLGDTEFEIKKIQEDFAQYKLNARLEKQKEIRKWQQAYNHLKGSLEYTSEDSASKLVKLKKDYEIQISNLKEKHEAELKQTRQSLIKNHEDKIDSLKKLSERELKQLRERQSNDLCELKKNYETESKQVKQSHQAQFRKLSLKHKQATEAKQKQYESIYLAIKSQKKTEQKLHQKTKIEASQTKQKLYIQLYYQRNVKKDLQDTLILRQSQIKQLKREIKELQLCITEKEQKKNIKIQNITKQHQKQKAQTDKINKQKIQQILLIHTKQLKKVQKTMCQLNQWKQNKEQLMIKKQQQIENKFDDRPSRQQDLDMIQKFRLKLQRRQDQLRLLNKQLKICVLQSQNKEQNYNKIFTSSTMNKFQKKCLAKDREEYKSKESLSRKSQTTDIKFLLKMYNKHI